MIIYGISNCDTVKKAKNWLDKHNIDYQFHDFRQQGLDKKIIDGWLKTVAWDKILNKRSTSWRNFCLLYTSPSPRDKRQSRMPSSA